ncbi:hypothetical protein AAFF_G00429590 [Aldrovandia affinis]|uniref:Uncharacterized protein n=1 Tax=Aldrovandia affinis TaxID=143900 RepID=A0AAD7R375_9TELE|nr:hypothetical protein AAFF_G00429590 [Aldrovandia affinis]
MALSMALSLSLSPATFTVPIQYPLGIPQDIPEHASGYCGNHPNPLLNTTPSPRQNKTRPDPPNKAEHQPPKLPCEGASPEGVTHRFRSPTPPGAQSARRKTVTVQDLPHRQTPQSTPPVEVAHRYRRAPSTHPAPPDSSRHPSGSHHLATGQPLVQGPVVQSLCTRDRGGTDGKPHHCS